MLKPIKWIVIGGIAAAGTAFFLFGEHTGSYISSLGGSIRDNVKESIPIDFQLRRAEDLIQDIQPEIYTCKRDLARAEVELESLQDDVERLERSVARSEQKLKAGREMLASSNGAVEYQLAGKTYPRRRVEIDLERTFEAHKNNLSLLRSKRNLIEKQSQVVAHARMKLDGVQAERARLIDTVATLKAQKQQVDAMAATVQGVTIDDSALSKAREVLDEVKKKLDVTQRMIEDDVFFAQGIPDEATGAAKRDIASEIDEFFAESATADATPDVVREAPSRQARPLEIR